MENKPSYYSILTADVRYDNRLSDSEKLLFAEITSLTQKNGECWASNDYFAKLYNVSISTISRRISNLKKHGYIDVKMIYKENSKEIEKRIIKIGNTYTQNRIGGIRKSDNTPIRKIDKDSITSKSNNTSINKDIVEQGSTTYPFSEIISYLNLKADTKYRASSRKTQTLIKARYNEGFRLEDFETVIDKKVADWKHDSKMNQYLRPETLFGTKFESYLNQKITKTSVESGAKVIKKAHDEKPPEIEMTEEEREAMIERIRQGLDF